MYLLRRASVFESLFAFWPVRGDSLDDHVGFASAGDAQTRQRRFANTHDTMIVRNEQQNGSVGYDAMRMMVFKGSRNHLYGNELAREG